jgi:hypothetical protein
MKSFVATVSTETMTEAEARVLTDRIKRTAEDLWRLLLEAHERKAWVALGYASWRHYALNEFAMGQSHAYRLLDQGRVIRALEEAAGSPLGEIVTERVARDVKPQLDAVAEEIETRVSAGEEPIGTVTDVISKARSFSYLDSRRREHRHSRHVEVIATHVSGLLDKTDQIDVDQVDRERLPDWVVMLRESARQLNRLAARLEGRGR